MQKKLFDDAVGRIIIVLSVVRCGNRLASIRVTHGHCSAAAAAPESKATLKIKNTKSNGNTVEGLCKINKNFGINPYVIKKVLAIENYLKNMTSTLSGTYSKTF